MMKTDKVRCWRLDGDEDLFISYPEGDKGHRLICCNRCGQVYSVNILKQIYIEPDLNTQLAKIHCIKCHENLAGNWSEYPETFFRKDGKVGHISRPLEIPPDETSIVVEFPAVY